MPTRLRTSRRFLIPATLEGPTDRAEVTLSVAFVIIGIAQEGNHLTYSRLPTNRNFVHGGPTGRAAQVHIALGKREDTTMDTPDKKQPKKHFFKIPANYFELSEEERQAFCLEIATILDADDEEIEGERSH